MCPSSFYRTECAETLTPSASNQGRFSVRSFVASNTVCVIYDTDVCVLIVYCCARLLTVSRPFLGARFLRTYGEIGDVLRQANQPTLPEQRFRLRPSRRHPHR